MTTIELEAKKALLVKEILTDINSEEMIEKLSHYLKRIKGQLMEKENPAPCQYAVDELKNILSELDIGIRLRKITQLQKYEIINEIKRAIADEREIYFDDKNSPSDNISRGNASASNDDLVDLIAMLNRGRSQ